MWESAIREFKLQDGVFRPALHVCFNNLAGSLTSFEAPGRTSLNQPVISSINYDNANVTTNSLKNFV